MYTYEVFKEKLFKYLQEHAQKDVKLEKRFKNNQREYDVIAVAVDNERTSLFGVEELYETFSISDGRFKDFAELILEAVLEVNTDKNFHKIKAWESCRDKICFFVINHLWNEKRLEELPHRDCMNLALAYRIQLDKKSTCMVTSDVMKLWGISEDILYEQALENLKTEEFVVKNLLETIKELKPCCVNDLDLKDKKLMVMYCVTNKQRLFGARALMRTDIWSRLAAMFGSNLVICPSSVHELIVFPVEDDINFAKTAQMVQDINQEAVNKEDRLADCIYYYDKDNKEMREYGVG